MNIFSNLKAYQYTKPKPIDKDEEILPIRKKSLKEKTIDFFEDTAGIWFVAGLLIVFGGLWYIYSFQFCGMIFFGILAILAFGLFAGGFANLSDWLEKKLGESKGLAIGCLGMLLGPIAAISIIVTSMPYWDYESYYEEQSSPTVYYTQYGECYHRSTHCHYIDGHYTYSVSKIKAKKKGLKPCSHCY